MPEAFPCYKLALVGNGYRCPRKSAAVDAFFQNGEGTLKLLVLFGESVREQTVSNLVQKHPQVAFVFGL